LLLNSHILSAVPKAFAGAAAAGPGSHTVRPTVSIGLPVFNGERYLERAVESILGQTYSDLELIISDNASTDKTAEICREAAERDERVTYIRNDVNLGAAENYNIVFRASNGTFFKWASHDDLIAPEFVERCVEVMHENPAAVTCYPRTTFIDEDGEAISEYEEIDDFTASTAPERFKTWLFDRTGPWCNAVFGIIRSDVLATTGLIGKYNSSDVILLGELLLNGTMVRIPDVLFYRRDHPERSVRAHASNDARAAWFDPASAGGVHMPTWRWLRAYAGAIGRADLTLADKVSCSRLLMRWAVTQRRKFKEELVGVAKSVGGRRRLSA
jgi:glycosyltransferase involved in cell wall biosynthesis